MAAKQNLTIDQGNTAVKTGVFDSGELIETGFYEKLTEEDIRRLKNRYNIGGVILSSVGDVSKLPMDAIEAAGDRFVRFEHDTPVPIENLYATPKTLGCDRLASCVGANYLKPDSNLLVVDMGTCITIDIVNARNQYLGGNISPGMQMRLKALNAFTTALPLVDVHSLSSVPCYGLSTQEAIASGVVEGITHEIEGYRRTLEPKFPKLSVFLTGGDAFFFERRLKSEIFVNRNLLLIGLNRIIDQIDA